MNVCILAEFELIVLAMATTKPFAPAELIVGIIARGQEVVDKAEAELRRLYGEVDLRSPLFPFRSTDYYEKEMGPALERAFLSFARLILPDALTAIKLETNALEEKIRLGLGGARRVVNLDPGILTASALIMATAKDFAHRVPLAKGIYGHLELLFGKNAVRFLDWTYPDFKQEGYRDFFLEVRRLYLRQRRLKA